MTGRQETLAQEFRARFGRAAAVLAEAPGRVNLIGEHTDYNGGFVLPVAIDRTVAVAAAPRDDGRFRALSLDYDETDEWTAGDGPVEGGWRNYVRGTVWALGEQAGALPGADLAIAGDVPQGAGLSSSAAIEVAVAGAVASACGVTIEPREVALVAHTAENHFAGVECGIMDQFASALGKADHALLIDCRALVVEHVPLSQTEEGVAVVAIDSMTPRRLSETPYTERRSECREAAERLGVASLRDADLRLLEDRRESLPEPLYRRARHVIGEDERVLAAAQALRGGDLISFGRLMYESHESLRDDFEASTPELDRLVEIAGEVDGVYGARLTGAGFGGSAVALARPDAVSSLEEAVSAGYRSPDGRRADLWVCRASDGLKVRRV